jgi:uncharacterized protein (DUF58 family)
MPVRRRYHVHPPGLLYLAMVVAVGAAAVHRPGNLLVWVFAAMVSGVLLSGVVSGWALMSFDAVRSVPRTVGAGEPLVLRYSVTNRSRAWPIFALFLRELDGPGGPRALVRHAGPGETVHAEAVRWPAHRGPLRFGDFRAESTFPFGLLRKSVRFEGAAECLVLPRTVPLRRGALESLAGGAVSGTSTTLRAGPGGDFLGIREYRPGDSLRHVAWRRSASGGPLAVVERSIDAPRRLRVVLDLRRPTELVRTVPGGPSARELEEAAISLAASLLAGARRDGFEAVLEVLGPRASRASAPGARRRLELQLCALAAIDLDAPRDAGPAPRHARERSLEVGVHPDARGAEDGWSGALHLHAAQMDALRADRDGAEVRT